MTKNWHRKGNYIYDSDKFAAVGKAFDGGQFSIEEAVEHAELMASAPRLLARAEAAEADAAACRSERARYGDMMTTKLAAAEAEIERLRQQVAALPQQIAGAVSQMPREEQDDLVNVQDILNVIRGIAGPLAGGSLWFAEGEWEDIVGSAAEADDLREQVAALTVELDGVRQALGIVAPVSVVEEATTLQQAYQRLWNERSACHIHLDESPVNDSNEATFRPLVDRIADLVQQVIAEREQVAALSHTIAIVAGDYGKCHDENVRLREQVATLEHATCSCCDRPVNRRIDAVVCDWCYEERLT